MLILIINPGSTSTKTAVFEDEKSLSEINLDFSREETNLCTRIIDQVPVRKKQILDFLNQFGRKISDFDAIAARGGPLRPVPGGVYRVNKTMLADAAGGRFIEHPSRIGCLIAESLGSEASIASFIVDPVSTDEYLPISRVSGLKEIPRKSLVHALNMKAVARHYAEEKGLCYEDMNLITVHLGGGTSVAVHQKAKMIDSLDANGEGPFSPERAGVLRADDLAGFVLESGLDAVKIKKKLAGEGGLMSHLGTTDALEVEKRIKVGDEQAMLCYEAMAYSVAKSICSLAPAVYGKLDAIIITGGLAHSEMLTAWITERVSFLAEVKIIPGEYEMQALAQGVLRVITGKQKARIYPTGEFEV